MDWKHRQCRSCPVTAQTGGHCVEEVPRDCAADAEDCFFTRCCAARLDGVEGWGSDCVTYGTAAAL
eukprot:2186924-Heterocapsa_arctica.AAC.1